MQTTPPVASTLRVANTKRWPLAWSIHSPGIPDAENPLPLPSVIVSGVQHDDASVCRWQATVSWVWWWKTL